MRNSDKSRDRKGAAVVLVKDLVPNVQYPQNNHVYRTAIFTMFEEQSSEIVGVVFQEVVFHSRERQRKA